MNLSEYKTFLDKVKFKCGVCGGIPKPVDRGVKVDLTTGSLDVPIKCGSCRIERMAYLTYPFIQDMKDLDGIDIEV